METPSHLEVLSWPWGLGPQHLSGCESTWAGQVFSNFTFYFLLGGRTSHLFPPQSLGRGPQGRALCLPLPDCTPAASLPPLLRAPTFHGEQVAGTEDAWEARSISARLLPGADAAGPRGGRAGSGPGCAVRPRDRVRTGSARPGAGGGRGVDGAERARGGRTGEARAGCLPAIWTASGAGARARGPGVRVASVGARLGDAVAWAEGAGLGARRRREGPPGSLGSPLWFPSCLPGPQSRAGVGAGGGAGTPLRVSSDISSGWEGSRCTAEPGQRARLITEPGPASS